MAIAADLNRALAECRALPDEPLAAAYRREFDRAARETAAAFTSLTAAAAWTPPTVEQVTNWSISMARIRGAQRRLAAAMVGRMNEVPGVDFNLTQPVVQRLLNQLAVRAEGMIRDGVRGPVAHAIARGWAEGRSVPQTAALIRQAVSGTSAWRATTLARTDLIGLSNGAGQSAVKKLNEGAARAGEPKPIATKTWTNAGDSRVRDTHQEAEGQTVPVDQPYRVGGQTLAYPGDPFGPHDEVVNCRCTEIFNEATVAAEKPPVPEEPEERTPVSAMLNFRQGPIPLPADPGVRNAIAILDNVLPKGFSSKGPLAQKQKEMADRFEGMDTRLAVMTEKLEGAHGEYRFVGNSPVKIAIDRSGPHPTTTALHELGHWLDHQELSDGPGFATAGAGVTPEMREFVSVAYRSAAMRQLSSLYDADRVRLGSGASARTVEVGPESKQKIRKYVDYLQDPVEIWARAFSQWAAKRSGDRTAIREIDDQVFEDRNPSNTMLYESWTQWDDDDFAPIAEAVEAVLRTRGLIDDAGQLSAAFRVFLNKIVPGFLPAVEGSDPQHSLLPGDPGLGHDRVDDLVLADARVAKFLGGDHAARIHPVPAVPFYRSDPEEVSMPPAVELKPVLRVVDRETGEDVTDQYVAIESNGEVVGFADAALDEEAAPSGQAWHSDTAFEGIPTGDGRIMLADSLDWRDPPLTLMAMVETTEGGHLGAQISGRMDAFEKRAVTMDGNKLPDGVRAVYSTGVFDVGEYGSDIERLVADETLRGISVDLSVEEWAFYDPETGEIIDPETATDEQWEKAFMGDLDFAVVKGTILAATVCPTPAFADARIALLAAGTSPRKGIWRAGADYARTVGVPEGTLMTTLTASIALKPLTASVSVFERAPVRPPRSAFEVPEPNGPQPISLDSGVLTGHLCLWQTCHTGFLSGQFQECIRPPRSYTNYADFHLGALPLDDGETLEVGKLTVGTGHADPYADRVAARAHYDHAGTVVAFVRAIDGKHGVWLSGVVKSDATDEQIRDLLACPLSGDWRAYNGKLELQAALAVVVPGFPVQRAQLALSAAGAPMTLILPTNVGVFSGDPVATELGSVWSSDVLAASIDGTLDEFIQADDCGCQ